MVEYLLYNCFSTLVVCYFVYREWKDIVYFIYNVKTLGNILNMW